MVLLLTNVVFHTAVASICTSVVALGNVGRLRHTHVEYNPHPPAALVRRYPGPRNTRDI